MTSPAAPFSGFIRGGLADPAAEEASDFSDHAADVFELTGGEPLPLMGEAEIEAEFIERGVGLGEAFAAGVAAAGLGVQELFR